MGFVRAASATVALILIGLALPRPAAAASGPEELLLSLLNSERRAYGLPALRLNVPLSSAAQSYAEYMAAEDLFSHRSRDGTTLVERDEGAGYTSWGFLGENLARGYRVPGAVVDAWMHSPTHRANVLAAEAREAGIGRAASEDKHPTVYWVLEVGTPLGWVDDGIASDPRWDACGPSPTTAARRAWCALVERASRADAEVQGRVGWPFGR